MGWMGCCASTRHMDEVQTTRDARVLRIHTATTRDARVLRLRIQGGAKAMKQKATALEDAFKMSTEETDAWFHRNRIDPHHYGVTRTLSGLLAERALLIKDPDDHTVSIK